MIGYYDTDEPDPDWDGICPRNHYENRDALRYLVEALYHNDFHPEFIEEQLSILCHNYQIDLPTEEVLPCLKRKSI